MELKKGMANQNYDAYITRFDGLMKKYIPPRSAWSPVDEALYGPPDPFRVPWPQAQELQLRALRFAFAHHYDANAVYRNFCRQRGVAPEQLRNLEDLERIPLIPDTFFKDHPGGRDFALWLENIFSGELPRIVIRGKNPTPDQVLAAFNDAGLELTFSSGTSGRHTFIPRDRRTFFRAEYAIAKAVVAMTYPRWEPACHEYLLMPDPRRTRLFAGRACAVFFDVVEDVRVAITRPVSAELIRLTMAGQGGLKGRVVKYFARRESKKMIATIVSRLEAHETGSAKVFFFGAPFLLSLVMDSLQKAGRSFSFGERGWVGTAGGWKAYEGTRIRLADFRRRVERVWASPKILPRTSAPWSKAMPPCSIARRGILCTFPIRSSSPWSWAATTGPCPLGEWGRFRLPGRRRERAARIHHFGDRVRMLERCPVCDRPGPVLRSGDPERAAGEDVRGCAEEVRRMLAADLEQEEV